MYVDMFVFRGFDQDAACMVVDSNRADQTREEEER
jgi:hypothetical protein